MAAETATAAARGIPSDRDAALGDRAGRTLDALICGTEPVSARFGAETVFVVFMRRLPEWQLRHVENRLIR